MLQFTKNLFLVFHPLEKECLKVWELKFKQKNLLKFRNKIQISIVFIVTLSVVEKEKKKIC